MNRVVLIIALFTSALNAQSKGKETKPNVLLIMVDDMNDWVGAFGGNQQAITPHMDKLAKRSTVFKNAYCSAALCNPSRTSMLTGYQPATTGVFGNSEHFRKMKGFENTLTLPQYFEKNGYTTAAAGKIFHSPRGSAAKPRPGSDPGSFQKERKGGLGASAPEAKNRLKHGLLLKQKGIHSHFERSFDWFGVAEPLEKTEDWKSADYCAQFLNEKHDKPFFLACGIFRPHLPWYAPKEFFDLYSLKDIKLPKVLKNDLSDVGKIGERMSLKVLQQELVKNNKWKEAIRAYLANLSFADACVGHVVDALINSSYNSNTIIVLMGDHGWHLGEKEHWSKNVLWERAIKTPLLIFDPRNEKAGISTKIVSLLDVYPTLVELCELPEKKDLEGNSLVALLSNPKAGWNKYALTSKANGMHSLRNKNYRYTIYPDGFEELYDHNKDPNEWENIASEVKNKDVINEFRAVLKEKLKSK